MSQHVWVVSNVDAVNASRSYKTSTDMLALTQHDVSIYQFTRAHRFSMSNLPHLSGKQDQIYAGGRNGIILQYDRRTPDQKGMELVRAGSSVTNLKHLRAWEMLVTADDAYSKR